MIGGQSTHVHFLKLKNADYVVALTSGLQGINGYEGGIRIAFKKEVGVEC